MEDRKAANARTSTRPHRSIGRLLELYLIRDSRGRSVSFPLNVRMSVLEIWEGQEKRGVPLYHVVRDDLVLLVNMAHGSRLIAQPSKKDFEQAVHLVKRLPRHPRAKDLQGMFLELRRYGYKLFLRDDKGGWRALAGEMTRNKLGGLQQALLRLAHGELQVVRPEDMELRTGYGRILERVEKQPPTEDLAEAPGAEAADSVDESLLLYRMQQVAQVAQQQGVRQQIVEYGGYVIRIDPIAYDPAAVVKPQAIRAKIHADSIHKLILRLVDDGRHRTMDECIWDLLEAPVPLTSPAFVLARKRFSSKRAVAEDRLQNAGYHPGEWHDRMAPVPNTRHRSKVIHWIRGSS